MVKKTKIAQKESQQIKPAIQIGKNGIDENTINHIKTIIDKKKVIKVKVLNSALTTEDKGAEMKTIALKIADEAKLKVIRVVGNVITLMKK